MNPADQVADWIIQMHTAHSSEVCVASLFIVLGTLCVGSNMPDEDAHAVFQAALDKARRSL